jgi:hypothetical protein
VLPGIGDKSQASAAPVPTRATLAPPPSVQAASEPVEARAPSVPRTSISPAQGKRIEGKTLPARLSVALGPEGGTLVNCYDEMLPEERDGPKTLSLCHIASFGAPSGADAGAVWRTVSPRNKGFEAGGLISQYAVAVPGQAGFYMQTELDSGSAAGSCGGSENTWGDTTSTQLPFASCEVWNPEVAVASRRGATVIIARGINGDAFGPAYESYAGREGSPWDSAIRDHLFYRDSGDPAAASGFTSQNQTDYRGAQRLALGEKILAMAFSSLRDKVTSVELVLRERKKLDQGAKTGIPPIVLAKGHVGMPTVAAYTDGFLVLWAQSSQAKGSYQIYGAQVADDGKVTQLGIVVAAKPGASYLAPALAQEGNLLALTFTEERGKTSSVRFACGARDIKALAAAAVPVSDASKRSRDSELALEANGNGLLAWHEFDAKDQGIRAANFRCAD